MGFVSMRLAEPPRIRSLFVSRFHSRSFNLYTYMPWRWNTQKNKKDSKDPCWTWVRQSCQTLSLGALYSMDWTQQCTTGIGTAAAAARHPIIPCPFLARFADKF
jgi:hypothetical protein